MVSVKTLLVICYKAFTIDFDGTVRRFGLFDILTAFSQSCCIFFFFFCLGRPVEPRGTRSLLIVMQMIFAQSRKRLDVDVFRLHSAARAWEKDPGMSTRLSNPFSAYLGSCLLVSRSFSVFSFLCLSVFGKDSKLGKKIEILRFFNFYEKKNNLFDSRSVSSKSVVLFVLYSTRVTVERERIRSGRTSLPFLHIRTSSDS